MVDAVLERFGRIDIVVNNAGMLNVGIPDFEFLTFLDTDAATWDLEIAMNLGTAFNVTHRVGTGDGRARMGAHRHGVVGDRARSPRTPARPATAPRKPGWRG